MRGKGGEVVSLVTEMKRREPPEEECPTSAAE